MLTNVSSGLKLNYVGVKFHVNMTHMVFPTDDKCKVQICGVASSPRQIWLFVYQPLKKKAKIG